MCEEYQNIFELGISAGSVPLDGGAQGRFPKKGERGI